jgi:hypothetical protein
MTALLVVAAVTVLYARLWRGGGSREGGRSTRARACARGLVVHGAFLWQVLIWLKPRRPGSLCCRRSSERVAARA